VGANFGLFTSVLSGRSKRVIAFEPNPACVHYLRRVLPRNCEVIAKAVSESCGRTLLRMPVDRGVVLNALGTIENANRFDTEARATEIVTHEVETTTLDQELLPRLATEDRVAFINIDAEGHEFSICKGAERLITSHRPVVLAELEYRHGAPVQPVFSWMSTRSYRPFALVDGRNFTPVDPIKLARLQGKDRLARRIAGDRWSGYVNNVFFVPAP
jgi:FkbM family methyltransferase